MEKELRAFSKEFDGQNKVDKVVADRHIDKFQSQLNECQKTCESRLQRELDEKFFCHCEKMLEEYSDAVTSILEDVDIEGFDFEKVSSLKAIKITDIDKILKNNQQNRYRKETREKDNPERAGFWGFFKFWKPRKISYTESVKEGVDVNVKNVIVDMGAEFSCAMKENIAQICDQAKKQIKKYEQVFYDNIKTLNDKVNEILGQLNQDMKRVEEIKARVESDKETLNWISDIEGRISTLLSV